MDAGVYLHAFSFKLADDVFTIVAQK